MTRELSEVMAVPQVLLPLLMVEVQPLLIPRQPPLPLLLHVAHSGLESEGVIVGLAVAFGHVHVDRIVIEA